MKKALLRLVVVIFYIPTLLVWIASLIPLIFLSLVGSLFYWIATGKESPYWLLLIPFWISGVDTWIKNSLLSNS